MKLALIWPMLALVSLSMILVYHSSTQQTTEILTAALSDFRTTSSFANNNNNPFIVDALCTGCRSQVLEDQTTCGWHVHEAARNFTLSLDDAGTKVAELFPQSCHRCNPTSCSSTDKRYWRYDRAAPFVQMAVTKQLGAVPFKHRIPSSATTNITGFFLQPQNQYPAKDYLFDYNPSIIIIPEDQRRNDAVYLASFRVSNQNYCFHPSDRKLSIGNQKVPAKNYVGFALLKHDLSIKHDVVIDLHPYGLVQVDDVRLFVLFGTIYIASMDWIAPIWLHNPGVNDDIQQLEPFFPPQDGSEFPLWIRRRPFCAPCNKKRGFCGKNFNYFTDDTISREILVEIWPSHPHLIRSVDVQSDCDKTIAPTNYEDVDAMAVQPSFGTVEELYFPALKGKYQTVLTRGRGGACCVQVHHPQWNKTVWVGIQHVKTPSQSNKRLPQGNISSNHYLSRLYAFDTTAPYRIVAISGLFCFGFPKLQETEGDALPVTRLTQWRKLILGTEFECPRIHFISGMTEKYNDPATVIIAYGINDCVSRFVQVSKSELLRLLRKR